MSLSSATDKAASICSKMANTKGSSSALMISKLFKGKSGKSDKKFDPKAECVVAS